MMNNYCVHKPKYTDIKKLAPKVCENERKELKVFYGLSVLDALKMSINKSKNNNDICYALYFNKEIIGIGGAKLIDPSSSVAMPWFLGVDMAEHKRFTVKFSKKLVTHLLRKFNLLINFVGTWNTKTLNWLPYAGFTVSSEPFSPNNNDYMAYKFWAYKNN